MDHGFERYARNLHAFRREEIEAMHAKQVCIVGCGGLGGYAAQILARFGILRLTLIDGDSFSRSNLNRQLFATEKTLGRPKPLVCKEGLFEINPAVEVRAVCTMLEEHNAEELLRGHDLVLDCLDTVPARRLLDSACRRMEIPYVHGAIGGFYGQVSCIFPEDTTLQSIYPPGTMDKGVEAELGCPSFIPPLVAALQCSEAIKLLTGKGEPVRHALLHIDLLSNEFQLIPLQSAHS